jgi:hypothetical protein
MDWTGWRRGADVPEGFARYSQGGVDVIAKPVTFKPTVNTSGVRRDVLAWASVIDPTWARVYDLWTGEQGCFLMCEYYPQGSWEAMVTGRRPRVPSDRVIGVIMATVTGMRRLHAVGKVHGRLSASNIYVDGNGVGKVGDFWLSDALMPVSDETLFRYAAPEVLAGSPPCKASDVFSLGVIMVELLTQVRLFDADNRVGLARQRLAGRWAERCLSSLRRLDGLPDIFVEVVRECLRESAFARPSVEELANWLESGDWGTSRHVVWAFQAHLSPLPEGTKVLADLASMEEEIQGLSRREADWKAFASAVPGEFSVFRNANAGLLPRGRASFGDFDRQSLAQEFGGTLLAWMNPVRPVELLYQSSGSAFSPMAFHATCDGHPSTVVLIRAADGGVYGGYAHPPWESMGLGGFVKDMDLRTFVFALRAGEGEGDGQVAVRLPLGNSGSALYCEPGRGPCFGRCDLHVIRRPSADTPLLSSLGSFIPSSRQEADAFSVLAGGDMVVRDLQVWQCE